MRRVPAGPAVLGLVVLFVLSVGAGYVIASRARSGSDSAGTVAGGLPASTSPVPSSTAPATTPTTEAPTTTAPPDTTPPDTTLPPTTTSPPRPARIILAGDSVMAGLAPPVEAALEAGGRAEVRFVLTPSILRDPTVRFSWSRQLEEFDPDLVVMFVGTWESGVLQNTRPDLSPTDPGWRTAYERDVLDPWLDLVTSRGAQVIWIGNPVVGNDDANVAFATLNAAFRSLSDRWPQVEYLDAGRVLDDPAGGFRPTLAVPGLGVVRTRQVDGLHLCPDGAALLGRAVVDEISAELSLETPSGWERGAWRGADVYPAASCPAP